LVQHRPVIGVIACGREVEGEPGQTVKLRYLEAVEKHADAAVLIIPSNQATRHAADIVARLDALLLTGSNSNIEPKRYGSSAEAQRPSDVTRDSMSDALIHAAITAGKPLFGVCRGLQEINVALGGSLRDLRSGPDWAVHHAPSHASLVDTFSHTHEIEVVAGSVLHRYAASGRLSVNSVHYQTIDRLGEGLVVNATGPGGVIEAISDTRTSAPVFAVQWHPEWRADERPHDLAFWHYLGEVARSSYMPAPGSEVSA
jgi:putative glutamine amidotransferase